MVTLVDIVILLGLVLILGICELIALTLYWKRRAKRAQGEADFWSERYFKLLDEVPARN